MEPDIDTWIHIGGTGCCEAGVVPDTGRLEIDSIDASGSILGRVCGLYWMPGLGQGIGGTIDASAC